MRLLCLFTLCLLAVPATGYAQQKNSKEPIEITAEKALEWHRNDRLYIAREKAVARQGTAELHGDTLTAAYAESAGGGTDITRIDAEGNVTVVSEGSRATGDKGYYDVKSGYSELTGGNLALKTPTDTVTARDKITYDTGRKELNAYGNARAVRGDDVITADRLIGRFRADPVTGETKMYELESIGNVVITTPTDVLYGDRGVYAAESNTATMTGNVRIERGPNIITGARGEVDLNTNISKIFGDMNPDAPSMEDTGEGRVRGVFYPE